ncbi:MAG: hypothetical protein ABI890_01850 [Lapillicoccus sp.]
MKRTKLVISATAGIIAAAGVVTGDAAIANAATPTGTAAYAGVTGEGQRSAHTEVTGAEMTKVAGAVTAKDSAVTVTEVRRDADGSYDVLGTKAGAHVMFDVSKDLATINAHTGGPGGPGGPGFGGGDHGSSTDTAVTSAERTTVTAAVTAKDPAVTVTEVRRDADGSYDVLGTKAGAHVMFDVSKDLATITAHTAPAAG